MKLPEQRLSSAVLTSYVDLDDDELERQLRTEGMAFPAIGAAGTELFDANGNRPLSADELAEMQQQAEEKFAELFEILRINRNDPNSTDTPHRLAKMWVQELLIGRYQAPPRVTVFPNRKKVDELVISKGIKIPYAHAKQSVVEFNKSIGTTVNVTHTAEVTRKGKRVKGAYLYFFNTDSTGEEAVRTFVRYKLI